MKLMELKSKKIVFLGDSITAGHGVSSPAARFPDLMEKYEGIRAVNLGIGGTRIAIQPGDTERNDKDYCSRIGAIDPDADVIVIFGGTNDFGHGFAPIGTPEDRTPDTFCGALHFLYSGILAAYPDAVTVVMTPLHRSNESDPHGDCKPDGYLPLSGYVSLIKKTAEYYSLPVLDLWSVSGMQPGVPAIREKFLPDGLHPNDLGHERIARLLTAFLKSL